MKVMKSVLLGSAAGMFAVAGAQAADLPVKAKAVEYVKVCPAYGAGFYYIPGTDICLKVGGYLRVDYGHNNDGGHPILSEHDGEQRGRDMTHAFHTRAVAILDSRQQTAYGTLRAYLVTGVEWKTPVTTTAPGVASGPAATAFSNSAFVQFAGFTFGRTASFFDFYSQTAHQNMVVRANSTLGAIGWNVLAYTAQFGGGMSASLSLEEVRARAINSTGGSNVRAGLQVPAIVGNLRWDSSAGSAQIMGAVQELNSYQLNSDRAWGWAVGAGFTWNNPGAPGSQFGMQANLCEGASAYCTGAFGYGFGGVAGSTLVDANISAGGSYNRVEQWSISAGYQHRWSPTFATSITGGYGDVDDSVAGDFTFWQAGGRALWTPVPGLDFGLDVMYSDFGDQVGGSGRANFWAAMFRVFRPF